MTSAINPNSIDNTYPVEGVSNPSQGLRDNFSAIKTEFSTAASEITAVQSLSSSTSSSLTAHIGSTGASHGAVTTAVNGFMIASDKLKLDGVADGATANQTDAYLLNRANHTGSQAISTITNLQTTLDGKATVAQAKQSIIIACSDETTAITTGTAKVTFRMPYAFTLSAIRGSLSTAQTSGSIVTVNIKESGVTILSTLMTFDNTEKTTTTAATPLVISDVNLADDAEITVDITQVGDGTAKGLKVTLIGYPV